ncbi:MAG: hypothetical protein JO336_23050 [Acidobacteriia bacterium]|nr:hypothetical protein [Terriglobia bacterium]MBV8902762.1 hypothetical protein [Terriglobia bacterium]
MTIDERLDRIEHVAAGLAEQWSREREENRQLWRETQRRIEEVDQRLGKRIEEVNRNVEQVSRNVEQVSRNVDEVSRNVDEVNRKLGKRIEALVSAMGEFIASQKKP